MNLFKEKEKRKIDIQQYISSVLQESLIDPSPDPPPGVGIAATKATREATVKRASLENMVKNERSVVSGEVLV